MEVRGEEGREVEPCLDLERGREAVEDMVPLDRTGVGAWTCIEMARVGRAGSGKRPRLTETVRGVDVDKHECLRGTEPR